jgi:hypothetical protein
MWLSDYRLYLYAKLQSAKTRRFRPQLDKLNIPDETFILISRSTLEDLSKEVVSQFGTKLDQFKQLFSRTIFMAIFGLMLFLTKHFDQIEAITYICYGSLAILLTHTVTRFFHKRQSRINLSKKTTIFLDVLLLESISMYQKKSDRLITLFVSFCYYLLGYLLVNLVYIYLVQTATGISLPTNWNVAISFAVVLGLTDNFYYYLVGRRLLNIWEQLTLEKIKSINPIYLD